MTERVPTHMRVDLGIDPYKCIGAGLHLDVKNKSICFQS